MDQDEFIVVIGAVDSGDKNLTSPWDGVSRWGWIEVGAGDECARGRRVAWHVLASEEHMGSFEGVSTGSARMGMAERLGNRPDVAMGESQDFHRIPHISRPQLWRSWGLRECWDGWRVTVVDGLRGTGAVAPVEWDVPIASNCRTSDRPGLGLDAAGQVGDLVEQAASLCHQLPDLAISVHDRGVIPTAEGLTDLG